MATTPAGTGLLQRGSGVRRVNLNLSEKAYNDLHELSAETSRTMTEVIRLGLGLVKLAVTEARTGNKLVVVSQEGRPLKEILLPN